MSESARLLRLLQLTDSGFPTGAFAFSHGLEGLVSSGFVQSERDVEQFIIAQLREGFGGIECPAMAHAWRASRQANVDALLEIDTLVDALKPVPVFKSGSVRTGRRLLESASGLLAGPMLADLRMAVRSGKTSGHHAVAFGVVMESAGQDLETASLALGAGFVNGLGAAAVRLGVIGQVAAQRIVGRSSNAIDAVAARGRGMALEEMGSYLPMIDVAGLRHPLLAGRVFAS
ncbi:MAG TPA: urease accessory UreF family protein [Thermomicrobiales bacterium]|nr:urease accessory UreF family protein [Thermomicrobiales bacterium]